MTDQELDALVDEATDAFENMESMTDVSIRLIGAVAALRAENARLREALLPLVLIADAYDNNALDDEARKSGAWGENTRPPAEIELYQGRGGKRLLTLQDAFAARQTLGGTDDPA